LIGCRAKPLKLIITSATLDGEKFSVYYNNCPVRAQRGMGGKVHT
jgi:ATP-dependent RNA helicase DHX8/PRP22